MKRIALLLPLILSWATAHAEVVGENLEYSSGGLTMKGYIAYDDSIQGKRPGVLVVHEWWGHNDYARQRARMLAEQGYTALAVDMYGDGKTADHPKDAGAFSGEVKRNMDVGTARFESAMQQLQAHGSVEAGDISAIGYCFGGGIVLEMARRGLDLDAVASFHGSLQAQAPAGPGKVKARVLVYNGADDPFVKPEHKQAFHEEMKAAGIDYRFIDYPGAKHSFTNPGADEKGRQFNIPLAYDKAADEKSWADLLAALKEIYGR